MQLTRRGLSPPRWTLPPTMSSGRPRAERRPSDGILAGPKFVTKRRRAHPASGHTCFPAVCRLGGHRGVTLPPQSGRPWGEGNRVVRVTSKAIRTTLKNKQSLQTQSPSVRRSLATNFDRKATVADSHDRCNVSIGPLRMEQAGVVKGLLWWRVPLVTALRRQRQVHLYEFEASLLCTEISGTTKAP